MNCIVHSCTKQEWIESKSDKSIQSLYQLKSLYPMSKPSSTDTTAIHDTDEESNIISSLWGKNFPPSAFGLRYYPRLWLMIKWLATPVARLITTVTVNPMSYADIDQELYKHISHSISTQLYIYVYKAAICVWTLWHSTAALLVLHLEALTHRCKYYVTVNFHTKENHSSGRSEGTTCNHESPFNDEMNSFTS